jgi:N-acetylneuraminic acid mutarotase
MIAFTLLATMAVAPPVGDAHEPLPHRVASLGACVAGDWLYVYGGHCGKTHTYSTADVSGRFFRVPITGGKWEELPGGPSLQGLALVADGDRVLRVGGMQPRNAPGEPADNVSTATLARYDPATRKWQDLPPMPAGRSSHDAVIHDGKLYVVGGWAMQGKGKKSVWHDHMFILDLRADQPTWKQVAQPFQRRALGAAVVGGKIHVVGGMGAKGTALEVHVYDPSTGKWSPSTPLPGDERLGFSPAVAAVGDRLVVSTLDGRLHRLIAGKWEFVRKQEVKRMVHRLVAVGPNRIAVVGGFSSLQDAQRVEVIDLP